MSRLCLYSCRITNVYDILFVTCSVVRLFITWEIKLTFVDQRGNYLFFPFWEQEIQVPIYSTAIDKFVSFFRCSFESFRLAAAVFCDSTKVHCWNLFLLGCIAGNPEETRASWPVSHLIRHNLLFINLHGDNWAYSPSSPSFSANSYCWQWRYGVWFIRRGKVNFCGRLRALIF